MVAVLLHMARGVVPAMKSPNGDLRKMQHCPCLTALQYPSLTPPFEGGAIITQRAGAQRCAPISVSCRDSSGEDARIGSVVRQYVGAQRARRPPAAGLVAVAARQTARRLSQYSLALTATQEAGLEITPTSSALARAEARPGGARSVTAQIQRQRRRLLRLLQLLPACRLPPAAAVVLLLLLLRLLRCVAAASALPW